VVWHDLATMMHPDTIQRLRDFRNELYLSFGKRADALFELCDAAVTAGLSPSLAYLSLEACPSSWLGQPLCRPGRGADRHGASPIPVGAPIPWIMGSPYMPWMSPSGRDVPPRPARSGLSTDHSTRHTERQARRGGLGLPVDRPGGLRPRQLDSADGYAACLPETGHRGRRRRADQGPALPSA